MADILSNSWNPLDSGNTNPPPDGLPTGSAPNKLAPTVRGVMGALRRQTERDNAWVTSSGASNVYALTYMVPPDALRKGEVYRFWANHSNTGAATLNINSLGAKPMISNNGSAMALGQITSGNAVTVIYDGTSFRVQSITTNPQFNGSLSLSDTSPSLILAETDTTTQGRMVLSGGDLYIQAGAPGAGASGSGDLVFSGYNSADLAVFKVQANGGLQTIWHSGNTGAGKGDDSDLLDGQHGAFYQNASNLNAGTIADARLPSTLTGKNFTSTTFITSAAPQLHFVESDQSNKTWLLVADGTAFSIRENDTATTRIRIDANGTATGLTYNGGQIWHAWNTGSGKGNDSDLLDGQHGSFYQNASNLNAGTLPNARISGAYDGITTLGQTGLHTITTTGEALRIASPDTASDPHLSFYKTTTRQGYIQSADGAVAGNGMKMQNDVAAGGANAIVASNLGGVDGLKYIYNGSTVATVWHTGNLVAADINGLYGYTPPNGANLVTAGNGLSGGGSIAASRTITLGTPSTITNATTNSVSATSHTHEITLTSADINGFLGYTPTNAARQVIAGNGLTGGGNFTADRTITLGTPGNITNSTTNSVTSTSHTHALGFTAAEVYGGTSSAETNYPLGHAVIAYTQGGIDRNASAVVYNQTGTIGFTMDVAADTALAGTWRNRGWFQYSSGNRIMKMQRTA